MQGCAASAASEWCYAVCRGRHSQCIDGGARPSGVRAIPNAQFPGNNHTTQNKTMHCKFASCLNPAGGLLLPQHSFGECLDRPSRGASPAVTDRPIRGASPAVTELHSLGAALHPQLPTSSVVLSQLLLLGVLHSMLLLATPAC